MRNSIKSRKEDEEADSSPFSQLPEEMILEILNKLIDFKTLCRCYLVSKHFSLLVLQVDAISFTAPRHIPPKNSAIDLRFPPEVFSFYGESFPSPIRFLIKFKGVKSLCVELPSSREIGMRTNCLFKWKVKFGNRMESFLFLAFNSICDKDGIHIDGIKDQQENADLNRQKFQTMLECLLDVMLRHIMLLYLVKCLPKLEEVSITDRDRRGRLSMSGKKLSEVKEWLHTSASEIELKSAAFPNTGSQWNIDPLNLPDSGNVMKGLFCALLKIDGVQEGGNDGVMNSENGFEGKEGAVYTEAVKVISAKYPHQD